MLKIIANLFTKVLKRKSEPLNSKYLYFDLLNGYEHAMCLLTFLVVVLKAYGVYHPKGVRTCGVML